MARISMSTSKLTNTQIFILKLLQCVIKKLSMTFNLLKKAI
jgi:hypothetical protein